MTVRTKITLTFTVEHDGSHVYSPDALDFIEGGVLATTNKAGSHGGTTHVESILPGARISCALLTRKTAAR